MWPAGASGHVAYVEVVTSTYIETTEDNYGGTSSRVRYAIGASGWPSNFIHIKDVVGTPPVTQQPVRPSYQADKFGDIALLHEDLSGGFDAHVLYGSAGIPFQHNPTFARKFSGADGWDWSKIKTSTGDYNGDGFDGIAVVHRLVDGGADIHTLWGGSGIPFTYPNTAVRALVASDGWNWDDMKIESR